VNCCTDPQQVEFGVWSLIVHVKRFLAKEEELVPPYRFKVYDLLVLPPSFPYGGMVSVQSSKTCGKQGCVLTFWLCLGKRLSVFLDAKYVLCRLS
jgi:hypothetical protein